MSEPNRDDIKTMTWKKKLFLVTSPYRLGQELSTGKSISPQKLVAQAEAGKNDYPAPIVESPFGSSNQGLISPKKSVILGPKLSLKYSREIDREPLDDSQCDVLRYTSNDGDPKTNGQSTDRSDAVKTNESATYNTLLHNKNYDEGVVSTDQLEISFLNKKSSTSPKSDIPSEPSIFGSLSTLTSSTPDLYKLNTTEEYDQKNLTHFTSFSPSSACTQTSNFVHIGSQESSTFDAHSDEEEQQRKKNIHIDYLSNISSLPKLDKLNENIQWEELSMLKRLINGSNSNIFKAYYEKRTPVIVKRMMKDPPDRDLASKEFALEHELLMRLSHANIVSYCGGGFDKKCLKPFLVLERLNGGSLTTVLNSPSVTSAMQSGRSPFSYRRVLEMGIQCLQALTYLHETFHPEFSLIHRDLKPDNIGFTDQGVLKLMDFGLCAIVRKSDHNSQTYFMTGNTGSLRYMAPEVIQCLPYNEKVDIYSFGLILWQVSTGLSPYKGFTLSDFFPRVVERRERPSVHQKPGIPEELSSIMIRCWDHLQEFRPTASDILSQLLKIHENSEHHKAKQAAACCSCSVS